MANMFSLRGVPVFASFFLWAFGTGGMQLARPLFAASFGVPLVLVTLVTSANSVASLIAGPVTGFAVDRLGRKPLLILGVSLRGMSAFLEFFAGSYTDFLFLEFFGAIGISMWVTGSSVLVADMSSVENRGRVVAARNVAARLGFISGPLVGAAIATILDLRWVFLFNAATKIAIVVIVFWFVRETHPESARQAAKGQAPAEPLSPAMFLSRPFLIIAFVAFVVTMMAQGIFNSLFPVYLQGKEGFSTTDLGTFMTLASFMMLVVSMPNGYLVDMRGRKITLVPGLLVLGVSAYLLGVAGDYGAVMLAIILYGIGEGVCFGASQAYAMDLAPEQRRGSFLGIWALVNNLGGAVAPVLIGAVAQQFGFYTAFTALAVLFAIVASVMFAFGPDTRPRRAAPAAAAA